MNQETITKSILSGIVDRYIREIARDPHRSIRKLVDMAECTSDGPTQKICYQMMQQMAADQTSPYYEMIHHLVTHSDPETVKTFGINLGHNAWTFGSGGIRRIITETNTEFSWAVFIDRTDAKDRIPFSAIRDLIAKGRRNEVYAWLLSTSGPLSEWDEFTRLFREHRDCVFGLITDPDALDDQILEEAAEIRNLMILLNTDAPDWQPCAGRLSEKGFLYSACRFVQEDSQAEEILNGSWFEDLVPHHPLMAFSIAADSLPRETARKIKDYIWDTRLEQIYPLLPADMISDFVIINRLVTHCEIFYRIDSDGGVSIGKDLQFVRSSLTCSDLFK